MSSSATLLMLVFGLEIVLMRRKDGKYTFESRELYGFKPERVDEIWAEKKAKNDGIRKCRSYS